MLKHIQTLQVQPGTIDLITLILFFIGIQALWVIPIIRRNNKMNENEVDIREEKKRLEKIFKKQQMQILIIVLFLATDQSQ